MDTKDLIRNLLREYYGILAANPDWDKTLAQFLRDRGCSQEDIWEHCPAEAEAEGWEVPDWF